MYSTTTTILIKIKLIVVVYNKNVKYYAISK